MCLKHRVYLSGRKVYGCGECGNHLALGESLMSKSFNGQFGKAFLFDLVVNVRDGEPEDRRMATGLHTVRDIFCAKCGRIMGWKYDKAYDNEQKYKEGKYILEKTRLSEVQ